MANPTQLDRIETELGRIHTRLDKQVDEIKFIKERLAAGEEEFRNLKWDIWLGNTAVKALCIKAGANEHAMALTARQAERFSKDEHFNGSTTATGAAYRDRDEETDPDGTPPVGGVPQ